MIFFRKIVLEDGRAGEDFGQFLGGRSSYISIIITYSFFSSMMITFFEWMNF